MLNPTSKTFSIRRLQGLCRSAPSNQGISFVPPSRSPKRAPTPALRPMARSGGAAGMMSSSGVSASAGGGSGLSLGSQANGSAMGGNPWASMGK